MYPPAIHPLQEFVDKPGGLKLVKASVPLSEMFNYVSTLRGMSKGRAQYTMQVKRGRQCAGGAVCSRACSAAAPLPRAVRGFARRLPASHTAPRLPSPHASPHSWLSPPSPQQLEKYEVVPKHIQEAIVAEQKGKVEA